MSKNKNQVEAVSTEVEVVEEATAKKGKLASLKDNHPKATKGFKIAGIGILAAGSNILSYMVGNKRGYSRGYADGTEYAENEINYNAYQDYNAPETTEE